ncbi:MAG: hypothetical protein H6659_11245 [Ardenticatenaceae bacterium]|nr:hypothetical protein [Anaerolineales bacterium]MCB8984392.1 hypothetical protein [Ardenticatenaceae bacterium]MCB8987184.1 hypothetical protein [Ardenticatenaceae bacterium]
MKRPVGITILAVLAGLAALTAILHILQLLGLLPISIGPAQFYTSNVFGAILWGLCAAVWLWVMSMLWTLNPFGWAACLALAGANLFLIVVNIIGQATWQSMLLSILVNGLVFIYCLLPGTRAAFEGGY